MYKPLEDDVRTETRSTSSISSLVVTVLWIGVSLLDERRPFLFIILCGTVLPLFRPSPISHGPPTLKYIPWVPVGVIRAP